ncbi:MAG: hypothetical protein ACTSYU_03295 [Promethearchaeota archaeon]
MEFRITPGALDHLETRHYVIKPITKFPKYLQFLRKIRIPPSIITQFYVITIPQKRIRIYRDHFTLVRQSARASFHRFSFDDFILAYISAEQHWPVVSFDQDLLDYLQEYLDYLAIHPPEVSKLPADSIVLLDTNLLIGYCERGPKFKNVVHSMMTESPSITFLLPESILEEAMRVYKRLYVTPENVLAICEIPEEAQLTKYVDDFEGFTSYNQNRRNTKKQQRRARSHHHRGYRTRKY